MLISGVYPFTVYVANVFNSSQEVAIKVTHHYHPSYYKTGEGKIEFIIDPLNNNSAEYTIQRGYRLGFPMLMGDEYLEIQVAGSLPSTNYSIIAGAKAKCCPNNELGPPIEDTYLPLEEDGAYGGGKWTVEQSNANWMLTIRKYGPDPIEENVTIGDVDI